MPRLNTLSLSFVYALGSALILVLFAIPLWAEWGKNIDAVRLSYIRDDAQSVHDILVNEGPEAARKAIEARITGGLRHHNDLFLLADAKHQILAGNLAAWPEAVGQKDGVYTLRTMSAGQAHVFSFVEGSAGGYVYLVGREVTNYEAVESLFRYSLVVGVLLALSGSLATGLMMRRAVLRRIDAVRTTTDSIVKGNLSERIPSGRSLGELDHLVTTINALLDALEQMINEVQLVTHTIAHDLRTPLAELRADIESALHEGNVPAQQVLESALEQVDQMIATFGALLRLAEIESHTRQSGFGTFDLSEVLAQVVEIYDPVAEDRGLTLEHEGPETVLMTGDAALITQALGNLVDNAVKYTPSDGRVAITVSADPDEVKVVVADTGPGLSALDLAQATQRFFRGAETRDRPGVGLGLSIVAAVARLHGGELELESELGRGFRARLSLPREASKDLSGSASAQIKKA